MLLFVFVARPDWGIYGIAEDEVPEDDLFVTVASFERPLRKSANPQIAVMETKTPKVVKKGQIAAEALFTMMQNYRLTNGERCAPVLNLQLCGHSFTPFVLHCSPEFLSNACHGISTHTGCLLHQFKPRAGDEHGWNLLCGKDREEAFKWLSRVSCVINLILKDPGRVAWPIVDKYPQLKGKSQQIP
eukprot:CAMPEP_0174258622 /NCGR_PEP_ID=MMETSP0439-20130205/7583_1 /TAXON_ID=0 /ORGANISM="Stereomyxa ramosa, Strain Chinc5" /LENGTH=186 /DNA_ID=CAMNT_0015342197 /DNA_START=1092 /DNA_END=1652 /DNA_ORIENTATION=-